MLIQPTVKTTVNAPASEVWRVMAGEFAHIDKWCSAITESRATNDGTVPPGAAASGRICLSEGVGVNEAAEEFTYYDEQAMRFGYKGIGLPSYIRSAENNYTVYPLEENKSVLEIKPVMEVNFFIGVLLTPVFKIVCKRLLEEAKYYIEHGQPHPRKLKAVKKQGKTG